MTDDPHGAGGASSSSTSSAQAMAKMNDNDMQQRDGGGASSASSTDGNQEAMIAAIRDMRTPPGMRRVPVPPKSTNRSIVYDLGVRFEQDVDMPDPKKQKWYCMVTEVCRKESLKALKAGGICIEQNSTGNAARHCSNHGYTSNKTRIVRSAKASRKAAAATTNNVAVGEDLRRYMALMYVKAFVVGHFLPFNLSASLSIRTFLSECCAPGFPTDELHPEKVKDYVVELYAATVSRVSHCLALAKKGAGGPILHANFEVWTSKEASDEMYVGLRLFWMSSEFILESALVSVKLLRPTAALSEAKRLSDVLLMWVEEVLGEYKLTANDLFSTVTDARSDVQRLCLKFKSSSWEWCFPHMLNCALVEAFGVNGSADACKNPGAREVLDKVKTVVEHLNKSTTTKITFEDVQDTMYGRPTKLVDAMPRRWISSVNLLEEVLQSWPALETHYASSQERVAFPLAFMKTDIEELYCLMKPVSAIIDNSDQTGGAPTGLSCFLDLIALRVSTLKEGKPLVVQAPRKEVLLPGGGGYGRISLQSVLRDAESLGAVARATRKLLGDALDKRFFNRRYGEGASESPAPDYVFEMAASMNPFLSKLLFVPVLCGSPVEAARVTALVRRKVVDLMTKMAEAVVLEGGGGVGEGGSGASDLQASGASKRKRKGSPQSIDVVAEKKSTKEDAHRTFASAVMEEKSREDAHRMFASGMFGDEPLGEGQVMPASLTTRQKCQEEFDGFLALFEDAKLHDHPVDKMSSYWRGEGKKMFPNMARAARVLLSVPASSAVLERDFSAAGRLVSGPRSLLDAAYAEMVLFLNGSQNSIPAEVPRLTAQQICDAVPRRLSNPRDEVGELSTGAERVAVPEGVDEYRMEQESAAAEDTTPQEVPM